MVDAGPGAWEGELKEPKPLEELIPLDACAGAGAGLASKKLPPPKGAGGDAWGGADLWLEIFPRLEKALVLGWFCNGGEGALEKLRLLNASFIPPKEAWFDCCGCC